MLISSNGKDLSSVVKPNGSARSFNLSSYAAFSGSTVSRESVMGLPAFWSAVMFLAKAGGTIPLLTVDRGNRNQTVMGAGVAKRLRYMPNPETPGSVFWTTFFANLVAANNAFALKLPSSDGIQAPELWWIPSELVQTYRGPDGEVRYDIFSATGGTFASGVAARHIFHVKGPSIDDPLVGASPIRFMRHALGNAIVAQEYQGAMYRSGGVPKGVLSIDEPLTLEQATTIRDSWQSTYGGAENSGRIAVLDRGAKFQATILANNDAQFIEQLQMGATDAARMFNLPPALIGAEGASLTYANAAHNDLHFLKFSLRPYLTFVEDTLNADEDFFGVHSAWVPMFETDAISRPDQATRYANYKSAIEAGWMDADEPRALEGLPPRKAGAVVPPVKVDEAAAGATDGSKRSLDRERSEQAPLIVNVGSPIVQPSEVRVEQPAPIVNVDVQPSAVRMSEQPAPIVNVNVPEQAAPIVNVEAPNVQVDVAAPNVTVEAPSVTVDAPVEVNLPAEPGSKKVKLLRDFKDQIIGAEIEES